VNSLIDPPPSSDRRSSSRSPGDTFLKRVSSDSAVPPFTPRPPIHPGSRLNHNHRTPWSRRHRCKLANVPAFLNESFIFHMPASRSRRVAPRTPPSPPGPANPLLPHPLRARKSHDQLPDPTPPEHQPRRRANDERRPDRQTGATASSAGRGRCARDTPSRRGDPGFGGLPLLHGRPSSAGRTLHPNRTAAPHPASPPLRGAEGSSTAGLAPPRIRDLRRSRAPIRPGHATPRGTPT
jgi:hypothetical protein